jgi:hypothetical protein
MVTPRPSDSASRRHAAAALLSQPHPPSLRAIARTVGLSVTTVSDVRTRLDHGETPGTRTPNTAPDSPGPPDTRHVTTALRRLAQDPKLRDQETGQQLLRWLHQHAITTPIAEQIGKRVPPHCAPTIATIARTWATTWLQLAQNLDTTHHPHPETDSEQRDLD